MGLQGAKSFEEVAAATRKMDLEQVKAVLSTTELKNAEIKEILASHGVAEAELDEMAAKIANTTATTTATSATGLFTGATIALKTAVKGLWATMMSNPLTAIITVALTIIPIISRITSAVKESREEAQQLAIDAGKAATDSANGLYSAYEKYKKLKEAIDNGTGSSEEFATAQQDVLNALHVTGKGVDELIAKYGSLDQAISGATKSQLDTDISTSLSGINASKTKVESELKTGWFGGNSKFIYSVGNKSDEIISYLQDAGFKGVENYNFSDFNGNQISNGVRISLPSVYSTGGNTSKATFDDLLADQKYLNEMMNTIRKAYGTDNDIFKQVSDAYNKYAEQLDPVVNQIDSTNELIAQRIKLDADGNVETYEDYVKLRNDLIQKLSNDNSFATGGNKSAESIIDSILGSDADYTEFYNQFNKVEELASKIQKVKEMQDISKDNFLLFVCSSLCLLKFCLWIYFSISYLR